MDRKARRAKPGVETEMVEARERPLSLTYRRPADPSEREKLSHALDSFGDDPAADRREMAAAFGLGFIALVFIAPVGLLAGWIVGFWTGLQVGDGTAWLVAGFLWLAAWGLSGAVRVARRRSHAAAMRQALHKDLDDATVFEENWRLVEALAFQEAEKLPLLYLARADDGRILALDEARLAAAQSGAVGTLGPPADALLVRAPASRLIIDEGYSGPPLAIGFIHPLRLMPDQRPAHGAEVDRPWDTLVSWLGNEPFRPQG